jgi:hypothetical protein
MTLFKPAARTQKKLRLAIDGPSGSGKTYSALLIAKGLAGGDLAKVALIDTERGSGSLYADLGPFSTLGFEPPYAVKRFVTAHQAAVDEGFTVIVVDSLTHFWSGEGGILDEVDKIAKASKSGNSFAAWKQGSPLQATLIDTMLGSPCHIIATMRSKTEWVLEQNDKGRTVPRKVGLAPDQRKDVDYEYDLVLDLSRDGHVATASKDRTGMFDDRHEVPSEAMGAELLAWLGTAATPPPAPPAKKAQADEQREQAATAEAKPTGNGDSHGLPQAAQDRLTTLIESAGRTVAGVLAAAAKKNIGDGTLAGLSMDDATKVADAMKKVIAETQPPDDEPTTSPADDSPTEEPSTDAQEPDSGAPAVAEGDAPSGEEDDDFASFDATLTEAAEAKRLTAEKRASEPKLTKTQLVRICTLVKEHGIEEKEMRGYLKSMFGITSRKDLTRGEAILFAKFLKGEAELEVAS